MAWKPSEPFSANVEFMKAWEIVYKQTPTCPTCRRQVNVGDCVVWDNSQLVHAYHVTQKEVAASG